ncbi:CHKA [Cordylochernes scorpioides]|uniref:CHKA n=1 Tax=Cordylochernes scorpioides TaxID=51811 RepID=A0ABY6L6G9_9ARAC|nr:CHKA [Cordylochernes scorpioides]
MMVTRKQTTNSKPRVFKNSSTAAASKKGDLRDHAYSICRNYLSGTWKSISSSDMVFKSITGGLSNLIYYCSLPETHTPLVGEPKQALLRMYGQIHEGQRDVIESVIFMMLSERKLGPQLYGIFPGGRLEEYIQARALTCEELRNPSISATIARKLAAVHSLNVPIKKEPTWLYDTMTLWLSNIRTKVQLDSLDPSSRSIAEKLVSHEFEDELQWLWSFLTQVKSPVVFCHNDLQEGNILMPEDRAKEDDQVVFIDFEYCSYNYSTSGRGRCPSDVSSSTAAASKKGDLRDHAYSICRNYLSGTWKSISSSDMVFKSITGGLSNLIYYCSLPETHTPLVGEPKQALLRMYGQIHEGQRDVIESVIFMMLSERKLGPQLYGIFPGGRLEEYIQARALTCEELRNPSISATIARKLAAVHSLNVPIKKEPTWLYDTMTLSIAEKLVSHEFEDELQWLWSFLTQVKSPVVFCHNDLQEGNILMPEDRAKEDDQVVFIDFEYCSYNYRGFDLANHFLEFCYDYQNKDYPYYSVHMENYPSKEQQLIFLRHYLSCSRVEGDDSEDIEQRILAEISCFTLASHFLWTLWAIHNATTSKIAFGYWEYGTDRLTEYFKHKERLLSHHRP